jgi:hypothetical protein
MATTIFEIGERVGFLTIVAEMPKDAFHRRQYLVRCDTPPVWKTVIFFVATAGLLYASWGPY